MLGRLLDNDRERETRIILDYSNIIAILNISSLRPVPTATLLEPKTL